MEQRIFSSTSTRAEKAPPPPKKVENKKKKINFKDKKNKTLKSLNEVELFLNDFQHFKRYIHLYKFFK